jgi:hypothetical protein
MRKPPIDHTGAVLFFQLKSRRYKKASTALTFNMDFDQWDGFLGDDVMAAALIDRVLHHSHLVNIRGNSNRMREHTTLHQMLLQSDVFDPVVTAKWAGDQGQHQSMHEHVCNLRPPNV